MVFLEVFCQRGIILIVSQQGLLSHTMICLYQVAERAIAELHEIARKEAGSSLSWRVEEAGLYWARGETDTAKHLMKGLLRRLKMVSTLYILYLGFKDSYR